LSTNYTNSLSLNEILPQDKILLYKDEVFKVVGAAMEVHKILGFGFLEPVYQEALEREFTSQKIPYQSQCSLPIMYKGIYLNKGYVADFIVFDEIIVEIKALDGFDTKHTAQVLNYLKATGFRLGLLINFGNKSLEWKRIIH
jgi:hypothetical protein